MNGGNTMFDLPMMVIVSVCALIAWMRDAKEAGE